LLYALGILQLFLAHVQHSAMVEPERSDADEQQRSQDQPQDAQLSRCHALENFDGHKNPLLEMLTNAARQHNGTLVLEVADTIRAFARDDERFNAQMAIFEFKGGNQ
jgi:hypothetical protein